MRKHSPLFTMLAILLVLFATRTAFAQTGEGVISLTPEQTQKALSVLREGLHGEEFWPSMHAAEGLTLGGYGDEVLEFLDGKLEHEQDDQKRCGLAREQVRAGKWQLAQVMLDILDKEDSYGHTHACESLYKVRELGDGRGIRRALQKSSDIRTQLMAAAALGSCGNPEAMQFLRKHLQNEDEEILKLAAWVIARIGDESDLAQLRKNAKTVKDPIVRAHNQHGLAMLGDANGIQNLLDNLSADDSGIRTFAATFAGEARVLEAKDRLLKMLEDAHFDARIRAAQSLLVLSRPAPPDRDEDISVDVYPASKEYPRLTEGSVIRLADGRLLYAVTRFIGQGSDFSTAHIIGKTSDDGGRSWSKERILQESTGDMNVMSVTLRRLSAPHSRRIAMFYLEKNSHEDLRVYVRFSDDETETFGERIRVTTQPGYHVLNNDRVTQLASGRLLVPIASTENVSGGGHFISRCCISDDFGQTWRDSQGFVDLPKRGAMEPEVIELSGGKVMMIIRNQLGHIATSISNDAGETWSQPGQLADLVAPEAPATLRRVPATGDLLLIWNNTFKAGAGHGGQRTPLTAAISSDEGKTWSHVRNLESRSDQTYSYTSLIFVHDRALLSYWIGEKGKLSSRFRSLPVKWFYAN